MKTDKMTRIKKIIGIVITIFLTTLLGLLYYLLEDFFYSDFGCGCSSTCIGYYPVLTSKLIGYFLLISSTILFISSIWKLKGLSRLWTIPAMIIFIIAFYVNGYMIFNKGACGLSLNQTTFFINQTKLGDYAKIDGESINFEDLKAGKLNGNLLGYSMRNNELTVFRIAKKPLKVQISFLFWKTDNNVLIDDISYGLNTFRNLEAEKEKGKYEFIGGQEMTEKDFLDEFVITQKEFTINLKNKKIINHSDGTTRFTFEKD